MPYINSTTNNSSFGIKINATTANGYPVNASDVTELNGIIYNLSIIPTSADLEDETNYSVEDSDVVNGKVTINFSANISLPAIDDDTIIGWRLLKNSGNGAFTYSATATTNFLAITNKAFADGTETDLDASINWMDTNTTLAANTPVSIPVDIEYDGTTAGDTITFIVEVYTKIYTAVTPTPLLAGASTPADTVTVYTDAGLAAVVSSYSTDLSNPKTAFAQGDEIFIKTIITGNSIDENEKGVTTLDFTQTLPQITPDNLYVSITDITDVGNLPTPTQSTIVDNTISATLDMPTIYNTDDAVLSTLYVWVHGTII